jgi:peptidoglycan/xylan/chitin deacetylase (PgdA/CDA1 family)
MNTLMRHAIPIAADHKQPLEPGRRYVVVTFDDGFVSAIENAVPELVQRRIPVAFFVVAGLLGTSPRWAEFGRAGIGEEIIATAERLRELPCDLITIGSHTMTHPLLTSLSEEKAKFELSASRAELKKLLNRDIKLFSFPYGAFNDRLIELCRAVGYERVFTVLPMPAFTDSQEFVTGRIAVNPTDWELEFRLKILGAYRWLPKAIAWKRKLFGDYFHESSKASDVKKGTESALYGIH